MTGSLSTMVTVAFESVPRLAPSGGGVEGHPERLVALHVVVGRNVHREGQARDPRGEGEGARGRRVVGGGRAVPSLVDQCTVTPLAVPLVRFTVIWPWRGRPPAR